MPVKLLALGGAFALLGVGFPAGAALAQFGQPDRSGPPSASDQDTPGKPQGSGKKKSETERQSSGGRQVLTESQKRCRVENRCVLDASVSCADCP